MIVVSGVAASAQGVIVASTDDASMGYRSAGQTVVIDAGEKVWALEGEQLHVVTGPGEFAPADNGNGDRLLTIWQRLETSIAQRDAEFIRRQGGAAAYPRDLWQVDVESSGVHCVLAGQAIELWRSDATLTQELRLQNSGGGPVSYVDWPAGQAVLPWPDSRPALPHSAVLDLGRGIRTEVEIVEIPPGSALDLLASFAGNGCEGQLFRLSLFVPLLPGLPE